MEALWRAGLGRALQTMHSQARTEQEERSEAIRERHVEAAKKPDEADGVRVQQTILLVD